jgi:hypothetical protein
LITFHYLQDHRHGMACTGRGLAQLVCYEIRTGHAGSRSCLTTMQRYRSYISRTAPRRNFHFP